MLNISHTGAQTWQVETRTSDAGYKQQATKNELQRAHSANRLGHGHLSANGTRQLSRISGLNNRQNLGLVSFWLLSHNGIHTDSIFSGLMLPFPAKKEAYL